MIKDEDCSVLLANTTCTNICHWEKHNNYFLTTYTTIKDMQNNVAIGMKTMAGKNLLKKIIKTKITLHRGFFIRLLQ